MIGKAIFNLLLLFSVAVIQGKSQSRGFDKSSFYTVLASGKASDIDAQLTSLKVASLAEKEAYEGTLLMRKAGLVSKPVEKLSLFKSGRSKLETAITKDNSNMEYRLLRIIIQEHAPKIVNYRGSLQEDSRLLRSNFKNLSSFLQQQILDYSKNSKVLQTL